MLGAKRAEPLLIGAVAAFAVLDMATWTRRRVVDTGRLSFSLSFLVPFLSVLAIGVVALRKRNQRVAIGILAGAGVTLTIGCWINGAGLVPSFTVLVALAILTIGSIRRQPRRAAIVFGTVAAFGIAAEALRPLSEGALDLFALSEAAFGIAVGIGLYLRWEDWRQTMREESALLDQRLDIARELHDMVGHYVTGIVVQAQAARHVATNRPEVAAEALESIEKAGYEAMVALRRMVGALRQDVPTSPVSWEAVEAFITDAERRGDPVKAQIDPLVRLVAPSLAPSVHRIITESFTNIRRHATDVTAIDLSIVCDDTRLLVRIRNDGAASAAVHQETFGIVGMRERAEALGGSLCAAPLTGGGWYVTAELPLEPTEPISARGTP